MWRPNRKKKKKKVNEIKWAQAVFFIGHILDVTDGVDMRGIKHDKPACSLPRREVAMPTVRLGGKQKYKPFELKIMKYH